MQQVDNPIPLWTGVRGDAIDAGFIYFGVAGDDPEVAPINCWLDQALTLPIPQPLRTLGGRIVSGENFVNVYVAETDYSVKVTEADGTLVLYVASTAVSSVSYQPLDADLTAIAALATTTFGRALLTLANQAALQAAVGIPAALPLAGGTVTGPIIRSAAGAHVYAFDPAATNVRLFFTAAGASDPTSQPFDIWLEAAT